MIVIVILRWIEPEEGSVIYPFLDVELDNLLELKNWLEEVVPDGDYGETIASMDFHTLDVPSVSTGVHYEELALGVRYNTGEGIYSKDCPVFAERRILRS